MVYRKLIFKFPPGKPPFIGVVYADNASAIIPANMLENLPADHRVYLNACKYPYMILIREQVFGQDHGDRLNYQFVTYQIHEANEFADKVSTCKVINFGHVIETEDGIKIARTKQGKPFVLPIKQFTISG